ncbi:MAG: FAD-dependent oxidoreductase [Caldilineaceae bacterium]
MQKTKSLPPFTIWLVCALALTLVTGMAPAPIIAQQTDKSGWQHATRLAVGPVSFGGDDVGTVTVRLTTVQGVPVGGEHIVLFINDQPELHASTAPSGIAAFALGPDVATDGTLLRFVFPGDDDHQASIAVQRLHIEPPTEIAEEPDELAQGALELPLLVLSLPKLAPRLWDLPQRTAVQHLFTNLEVPSGFTGGMAETSAQPATETGAGTGLEIASGAIAPDWQQPSSSRVVPPALTKSILAPDAFAAAIAPPKADNSAAASAAASENSSASGSTDNGASVGAISQRAVRDLAGQPWAAGLLVLASVLVAAPALHLAGRRRVIRFPASLRPSALFAAIPMPAWYVMRVASIGIAVGLAITLVLRPQTGLFLFWRVVIPVLPLLFFLAPALWRNICPMAALNQAPRLFHFTRGLPTPRWLQNYSYVIAASLFLILASTRKVLFNTNGLALAVMILCALGGALLMGAVFRGKSGWCSSICPLLPIQRVYGQTAFVTVPHRHCQPCLGCTRNCFDLSPRNALLADLHDDMPHFAGQRKVFAGIFLGFILGFFLMPDAATLAVWQVYAILALASLVSLGSFFLLESIFRVSAHKLIVLYGAAALTAFYWFNAPGLAGLVAAPPPAWLVALLRASVLALAGLWVVRTFRKETEYAAQVQADRLAVHVPTADLLASAAVVAGPAAAGQAVSAPSVPMVTVEPEGTRIAVSGNRTLLEIIEQQGLEIEAGCRMGLCGADPICVLKGMENLSKCGDDERTTLERLGLAPNTRMACMARVRGDVSVGLKPAKPDVFRTSIVTGFPYDKSVERVVIIGNGIAGVTAADHIRRRHPKCEIHLVGRERHHLYNRMGITRLIYGRSAMQGLYLLPEQWYEDFNVTCWLNTQVTAVDSTAQQVTLGTGETLPYDRLILTTGSQSFVPPIEGFGMPGTFVLRTADDAMAIRTYVQEYTCRQAVVAGGGLLGLEAAYGLHKLGIAVTVLERSSALLSRQLDAQGAAFLAAQLAKMGITVLLEAEVAAVKAGGDGAERSHPGTLTLKDGRTLPCDLLLVAAGIRADLELAQRAGIMTNRGIVVDAQMRTSNPYIYAAGDVVEFDGALEGLWPAAVSQGTIAAANAVAAPGASLQAYAPAAPVTTLKVAGVDLTTIGRFEAVGSDELTIALAEHATNKYRKLVIAGGKIAGAILLGYPEDAAGVTEAVRQKLDVTNQLEALRSGDWSGLRKLVD